MRNSASPAVPHPRRTSRSRQAAKASDSELPIRLLHIAAEVLRREGTIRHIDGGWLDSHLRISHFD